MIVPHDLFLRLGENRSERLYQYRSLFENQLEDCDIHSIRKATAFSVPLGSERFVQQI